MNRTVRDPVADAPTPPGNAARLTDDQSVGVGCALLLTDYQENVLAEVCEPARAIVERNVCTIATAAPAFGVPVVISTVGVEIGLNRPTIRSLRKALPNVEPIDRSCINAWDDPGVLEAVDALGCRTWVMAGIVTSVSLTYPALCALADGCDVCFVEDAVADITGPFHQAAVARLVRAGVVPCSTRALISGWAEAQEALCPNANASLRARRTRYRAA
jgi:nicotinamidase-related amidase